MMKNILSIDTVFGACAVGVMAGDRTASRIEPMQRGQSERLMPMILDVVAEAGITIQDLNLIVVNVGPGSFTGVRVGIATARGIALGLNIPVQGVCACDALANMVQVNKLPGYDQPLRVSIDSGRDDYFVADYEPGDLSPIDPLGIKILSDIVHSIKTMIGVDVILASGDMPYPIILAGSGVRLYTDQSYALWSKADPMYLRDAEVSISKKDF